MEVIRLENVEKTYSDNGVPVHALRGVDLQVKQGEFTVIAGPSGSGKTTLLNIMGALDIATKGKVYLENESIGEKSRDEISAFRLEKLGFVFQAYNLIPVLTAMENIEFTMMLLGIDENHRRERAREVMRELDIEELAEKRPNEMSGGQQQRVAVARAIVNNPSIILADEPTANLDSATSDALLEVMERLNRDRGVTFVFATHDPRVMERSRRLIRLVDGSVVSDVRQDRAGEGG